MKVASSIFVLVLLALPSLAQPIVGTYTNSGDTEASILTCTKRKDGLYKTFEEFKHNVPSITKGYLIKQDYYGDANDQLVMMTHIEPTDSLKISKKDLRRLYWGYCDSGRIYFNSINIEPDFSSGFGYYPFDFLGRYCFNHNLGYSQKKEAARSLMATGAIGGLIGGAISGLAGGVMQSKAVPGGIILNLNNGKFYSLTNSLVMTILEKDSTLLGEYKLARRACKKEMEVLQLNERMMREYVDKYSHEAKF